MPTEESHGDKAQSGRPIAGARLREARNKQKRELADLARELHVDIKTLTAIEENRFKDLGAPVFAKGHLRAYAEALGISPDEILEEYRELRDPADLPPIVSDRASLRHGVVVPPWFYALFLAFVLLALVLWWFLSGASGDVERSGSTGTSTAPAARQSVDPGVEPVASGRAPGQLAMQPEEPDAENAADMPEPAAEPGPIGTAGSPSSATNETPAPAGEAILTLMFSDECWTEIRDANGRRLFSGIGVEGQRRTLRGPLPFSVVLGNAGAVDLELNGESYAIPAQGRSGRTARFRIPVQ